MSAPTQREHQQSFPELAGTDGSFRNMIFRSYSRSNLLITQFPQQVRTNDQ